MKLVFATLALPCLLTFAQTPAPAPKPAATPAAPKPAAAPAAKPATPAAKPAATPAAAPAAKPLETDTEKAVYALGLNIFGQLGVFDLSPAEIAILQRAIGDAAANKPAGKLDEWGPKINELAQTRRQRSIEKHKTESAAYLAKAAQEPLTQKTESGILYRELTAGTGDSPKATDTVKVHYRGTLVDGTEFDSSYKRNEPASFALNQVVKCWTEGVQKMRQGGKARLVCPSDLAYGDQGRPSIPPASVLIFEIELLEITKAPSAAQ